MAFHMEMIMSNYARECMIKKFSPVFGFITFYVVVLIALYLGVKLGF